MTGEETESDWLARRFEDDRRHLQAVAYRMLGSTSEANDAVQEAWLRLSRTDANENMGGWLTTVVGRVCLNRLRDRRIHREEPLSVHVPDPIVTRHDDSDPEESALLADSVGLALLVVLETLGPAERLAFVLHDLFAVPSDQIAPLIGRSPVAARQRPAGPAAGCQGEAPEPDTDLTHQREAVDAFFAARNGDFDALVAVLDPDVGGADRRRPGRLVDHPRRRRGRRGRPDLRPAGTVRAPAIVNGIAGAVVAPAGRPVLIMAFTVRNGKIAAIDALADRARLRQVDLSAVLHQGS